MADYRHGVYQKTPTIVQAHQAHTSESDKDYGELGMLASTDWIIMKADGSLATLDNSTFSSNYTRVDGDTTLQGSDV